MEKYWELAKGYKTYAVAVAGIVWGIHTGDARTVLISLALVGVRSAIATAVEQLLVGLTAKPEVPAAPVVETPAVPAQ